MYLDRSRWLKGKSDMTMKAVGIFERRVLRDATAAGVGYQGALCSWF